MDGWMDGWTDVAFQCGEDIMRWEGGKAVYSHGEKAVMWIAYIMSIREFMVLKCTLVRKSREYYGEMLGLINISRSPRHISMSR